MNKILIILISLTTIYSTQGISQTKKGETIFTESETILTDSYELVIPKKQKGLLILFPCFPCNAENTKTEFNIVDVAIKKNIAVLMMNFNQHLWLSEVEKEELENIMIQATEENKINTENIFIGGFSSGGNVSLILTNYLKSINSTLQPKGVFIVDSPIDLLGLYEDAKKDIKKNYSEVAVEEALWIVNSFESEFGTGDSSLSNYEIKSPYVSKTNSMNNLSNLNDLQIRLYTEPDLVWWKKNRQTEYEDTNAYYIELLANSLRNKYGENSVRHITTKNKGYRSNGQRHPHSWSIVDKERLLNWILNSNN